MPTIHLFGNPDLPEDALAPSLLPELQAAFPALDFRLTDPNELDLPTEGEDFIAIDVVDGLKTAREITIAEIAQQRLRNTTHDFDLASFLLMTKKLRPESSVRIFGLPLGAKKEEALASLIPLLRSLQEEVKSL